MDNNALILKVFPIPELGELLVRPGVKLLNQLIPNLGGQRMLLMPVPRNLVNAPSGAIEFNPSPEFRGCVDDDTRLVEFFAHESVAKVLGSDFKFWLERISTCQAFDGEFCDKNLTHVETDNGAIRLCWHHDNQYRNNELSETRINELNQVSNKNRLEYALARIRVHLGMDSNYPLNHADVCFWAILKGVYELLPEEFVADALKRKTNPLPKKSIGYREAPEEFHTESATSELSRLSKVVKVLEVDDEPFMMYMARPKEIRWESEKYLKFVRSLPCVVTGKSSGDYDQVVAHHLIGYGEGKMGGKAHDIFTFPISIDEHRKLHDNVTEWEERNGSQLYHVKETIKKAFNLGALS